MSQEQIPLQQPRLPNRPLNRFEVTYFNNLWLLKEKTISRELDTMVRMGFEPHEFYFVWDWVDDDIQVVPACMVTQCHKDS